MNAQVALRLRQCAITSAAVPTIGVMREGPLHAALKEVLSAPGDRFEVPVGRFVIDLVRRDGELVEVQTGAFGPLGKKLDALLDDHRIRIVHPVASERRIVRVDEHGEVLSARRSPKRAGAVEVFDKLVAFPSLLTHPNLTVEVLLLREDHVRGPEPTRARNRFTDSAGDGSSAGPSRPGATGRWSSSAAEPGRRTRPSPGRPASRRSRRSQPSRSARASSPRCCAAASCSPSGPCTACG